MKLFYKATTEFICQTSSILMAISDAIHRTSRIISLIRKSNNTLQLPTHKKNNKKIIKSRLPSNLKSTIRECVHLYGLYAWSLLATWQKWRAHHPIRRNRKPNANVVALCFIEPELLPIEIFHCSNSFSTFLLLWPWPWPDDLHIWTLPVFYRMSANALPTSRLGW